MAFLDLQQLEAGLTEMNLSLNGEQIECIDVFAESLYKWNRVYNLTAIQNKEEILTHHILDSLSTVAHLKNVKKGESFTLLDVGSGGGLPAIPLAICMPECKVHMIDAVAKKVAFLRQVTLNLRLANAKAFHGRVESSLSTQYDVITSRAFSSLPLFFNLTKALLKPDGCWLAMKGLLPRDELIELDRLSLKYEVHSVDVPFLDEKRHLICFYR